MDRTIVVKMPGSGMTVFNRYKLNRVLGRGGMGVVWLADDLKLERPVALKFLPSLIGLDPAAVKELKTETRRGLELSHPHIVRIYDFVDDEDAAAISMEFVDGKTLSELRLATEGGVFTTEEVSQWLLGVCDALDYAHFQRKVVHRDLKPANIMITTRDAVAKVADFGIARSLSDTMSRLSAANLGGTSGTLPYMSPQQAMGERPLPTDDVYSLGATLYELFTGKPPFYRGDLPMQINSKIPPSVAERRQELDVKASEVLPKHWEEAIAACLKKDANMRPSCAGALAEMLGLKPSTGTSRTVSFANSTRSLAPEKPEKSSKSWLGIAAALAVVAGGAAFYLKQEKPANALEKTATKETKPGLSGGDVKVQPPVVEGKPSAKKIPEVAQNKPVEISKLAETAPTPQSVETSPMPAAPVAVQPPVTPTQAPGVASAPMTAAAPTAVVPPAPVPAPAPAPTVAVMPPASAPPPSFGSAAALLPTPTAAPASMFRPAASPAAMPPPVAPSIPLPPGYTPPPDIASQLLNQPIVADPPSGFWTVEQMFPTVPFTNYSATGKRYLLFRTQTLLKEQNIYSSTVDGKEGKGTHNAIRKFQETKGLRPTGMLDVPTLAALQLSREPDNLAWTPPASAPSSGSRYGRSPGGGRYTPQTEEQPGKFKRALNSIFGDD